MFSKINKLKIVIGIVMSIAMLISENNIENKVLAKIKNPIDTGNGYEYSNGKLIGKKVNLGKSGSISSGLNNDLKLILEKEYNIVIDKSKSDDKRYRYWGADENIAVDKNEYKNYTKRYPDGFKMNSILAPDYFKFYYVYDMQGVIYDYGCFRDDNSLCTIPYGGAQAYDFYGYDENGFDVNGYDKDGYKQDGYNDDGYDKEGYDRTGYNKNGFDKNNVDKEGCVYTGGYDEDCYRVEPENKESYDFNKWSVDGHMIRGTDEYNVDKFYGDRNGEFNFNIADNDKIKKYYSGCGKYVYMHYMWKNNKNKKRYKSAVLYITVPKAYKKTHKSFNYIEIWNGEIEAAVQFFENIRDIVNDDTEFEKKHVITSTTYKLNLDYEESVFILGQQDGYKDFSYKFVPSTKDLLNTNLSSYKEKMISANNTEIDLASEKSINDDIYLANIDARNIEVETSDSSVVKVSKTNKLKNTYVTLKLTGGSKSGKATVTVKDKKSGKKQKITVTNVA